MAARGYYFEGAELNGKTFGGFLPSDRIPFASEWGLVTMIGDLRKVIEIVGVDERRARVVAAVSCGTSGGGAVEKYTSLLGPELTHPVDMSATYGWIEHDAADPPEHTSIEDLARSWRTAAMASCLCGTTRSWSGWGRIRPRAGWSCQRGSAPEPSPRGDHFEAYFTLQPYASVCLVVIGLPAASSPRAFST